jgi:hypothetical protein
MNKLLAAILLIFFPGCSKPLPPRAQADRKAGEQRELNFLAGIPEFRELSLSITEDKLKSSVNKNHLIKTISGDSGLKIYHIYRQDGENVLVMFHNGKCSGIQRMPRDPIGIPKAG